MFIQVYLVFCAKKSVLSLSRKKSPPNISRYMGGGYFHARAAWVGERQFTLPKGKHTRDIGELILLFLIFIQKVVARGDGFARILERFIGIVDYNFTAVGVAHKHDFIGELFMAVDKLVLQVAHRDVFAVCLGYSVDIRLFFISRPVERRSAAAFYKLQAFFVAFGFKVAVDSIPIYVAENDSVVDNLPYRQQFLFGE